MSLSRSFVYVFFRVITSLICHIDDDEMAKIPRAGPLIIYTNHVNAVEIPIMYTRLFPRPAHGMLLAERWKIPILSWMLDVTGTIPLHRASADIDAIRVGLKVLENGEILVIAPEGTRSHDGTLGLAHPGVVTLALHSGAPLIPLAYFGAEKYAENLSRLRRTDFHMRVGEPFHLDLRGQKPTRQVRQQMVDEMMIQLAALLPPEYRGEYAQASAGSDGYLRFS